MSFSDLTVCLSRDEVDYLRKIGLADVAQFVSPPYKETASTKSVVVTLSHETAESIRDVLTNQLGKVGFDKNYDPTDEGKLIEDLLDRFLGE